MSVSVTRRANTAGLPGLGGVSLRPVTSADVARLTVLIRAAYGHYVERLGGPPRPMTEGLRRRRWELCVTVAARGGEIVGLIVLRVSDEGFLVDPVDRARQGIAVGKALLQHAEVAARQTGFDSIYLYTHERRTENLALYSRIGYVEYDRSEHGDARVVHLRKKLA